MDLRAAELPRLCREIQSAVDAGALQIAGEDARAPSEIAHSKSLSRSERDKG